ncbi:FAD-dependent oxidoreductase [Azospirillum canadense]|uniref:FAD-dependent oxidoreductase n=1 Tax=Azospirillum canadense TaxID=403962 RepID=UPI002226A87C|nr:FAD-dependent oxidoreductase [Azospirillum canadense]MCW2244161.1 anthranilate 1,2-dioxygenase large subunit [Azospirillum canadense]
MPWVQVASSGDVRESGALGVDVEGTPVALFRVDGAVYATHNICTHQFAFLSDGYVEDGCVECPLHQALFDIRTGKAKTAPASTDLRTFAAKEENGAVYVDLTRSAGEEAETPAGEPVAPAAGTGERLVILGAGQAGARAAEAMRQAGHAGPILLIGDEDEAPYERPPLSKELLLGTTTRESIRVLPAERLSSLNVGFCSGCRVTAIDRAARTVSLSYGSSVPYDKLLIATGARARRLPAPGADLPGVHHLRTIADAEALGAALTAAKRVVVIGAGFIGLEIASAARKLGAAVTILERADTPLERLLPPAAGRVLQALAEGQGVAFRFGVQVAAIRSDVVGLRVDCAGDDSVAADVVVVGIGTEANLELARDAGLAVADGIVVDGEGRTSDPAIFAAGDVAHYPTPINGRRCRLESWQHAQEQAIAAGRTMAGQETTYSRTPWFWTDQFDRNIQMIGLPSRDASVLVRGTAGEAGSVLYLLEGGTLSAAIAFDDPQAIRDARARIESGAPVDAASLGAAPLSSTVMSGAPTACAADGASAEEYSTMDHPQPNFRWPEEGLTRIPDWVYTDETIYKREVERIFHGRTWNYVALEAEIPNPGDHVRSNVGPTPVVVSRAEDGSINVFENRCAHRAAEFCRSLRGNAKEFVCPYHQWSYDLKGNLVGVPFRRGVDGKGGMPKDFRAQDHGLTQLTVTTHRGVVFASYASDMEPLADYLGPDILGEFEATFDGRPLKVLGYYRNTLPGNWKLYHENLKDPYHATLLHTFLVSFGLLVAGNRSLMLCDESGRHGVMASAKSDGKNVSQENKKEMRAYQEGMVLEEPRFVDYRPEFDSPWSVTMMTVWPNMIVQREMNTLGIRQIVPTGPNEFIMNWTMFGFEGDDDEMLRHRLRQGNLMGPAGFLGLEDNEAIKYVQDGMKNIPDGRHLVALDPATEAGTSDTLISESAIRAMYRHWRSVMDV